MSLRAKAGSSPSLVGVIHLPALGGAPLAKFPDLSTCMQAAGEWAVREAQALEKLGFQGLILENFGDFPFYGQTVPPETVASMAVIAAAVREACKIPLGINILRNDARAALAVAAVAGCQFIRVNVLAGVAATDQGLLQGCAAELLRERARLEATVGILADVHVKHAQTLSSRDIAIAVEELATRALADGVIITGPSTGREVADDRLAAAARAARDCGVPLWIGSGATADSMGRLLPHITGGVIVGSALRSRGQAGAPLDLKRAAAVAKAFHAAVRKAKQPPKRRRREISKDSVRAQRTPRQK